MPNEPEKRPDLESMAELPEPGLISELLTFLMENKKWWLLPILVVIGLFSLLVVLASSGAAPFIYTLF